MEVACPHPGDTSSPDPSPDASPTLARRRNGLQTDAAFSGIENKGPPADALRMARKPPPRRPWPRLSPPVLARSHVCREESRVGKNGTVDTFRLSPRATSCRIWVNDKSVHRWLRPTEQRADAALPGDYEWLPPELALLPSRHLLGEPLIGRSQWGEDWTRQGWGKRKVAIGGCLCGNVGCGPLLVTIEVHREVVVWHGFVSRTSRSYGLGFTFDRRQYESQLQSRELD